MTTAQRKHALSRLALLLLAVPLVALCPLFATAARAASLWGELGHTFIQEGTGAGQLNVVEPTTVAIDPGDGSVYMADQIATKAHPTYRIQRINAKGEVEASATFTPPEEQKTSLGSAGEGVQLAVDPTNGRVYALVVYRRREEDEKEEKELEEEEKKLEAKGEKCGPTTCYARFPLDSGELTTGELYAFEYTGGQLVPAKTEEPTQGVKVTVPIVTDIQFKSQGEHPKEALLNPHGMAVEPSSGDVVITGDEDQQEDLNVEKGATQQCRAAAQFITVSEKAGGELSGAIGNRYVDNHEVIQELACEKEADEYVPFSPFVSAGGRLFAEENRPLCPGAEECHGGEIWELPKSSELIGETGKVKEYATAPHPVFWLGEQQLQALQFGPEGGAVQPTMSYVAEAPGSTSGKVYLSAEVLGKKGEARVGAVLTVGYDESGATPKFTELGWTGGGHEAGGGQEGCVIPDPNSQAFFLGGFKGATEGVTVFDLFKFNNKNTIESLQFGPGGSTTGCPHAILSQPSVEVNGSPVTKLVPGEVATISSTLEAASPLGVEWKLENTTTHKTETVPGKAESQTASLTRSFSEEGAYKVTAIVQTNNLAYPVVEVQLEHELEVKVSRPEFEIVAFPPIEKDRETSFEAIVFDENKQTTPYKYVWQFGDGAHEEGVTSSSILQAKHTYASPCESCTVTLEVTDQEGVLGKTTSTVDVGKDKAEKEAEAEAARIAEEAAKNAAAAAEAARIKAEEAAKHAAEEASRKAAEEAAKKHAEEEAAAKRKAEESKVKSTPTRAQLLAKALVLCKKQPKKKRHACEATARKRYGPKRKHKPAKGKK